MYNRTTVGDPTTPQDQNQKFGNWTGQTDTKVMAKDLMKRGLVGADQLLNDVVDITSGERIRNTQSDWKVNAIQEILANARKFNLRKPEEVLANKNVLLTNPKWKEAVNDPYFNHIHPNFWQVLTESILPEQYKKYDMSKNNIAKK